MIIADSGIQKRYNKFKSINNDKFIEILKIAENHRYGKEYKNLEYDLYIDFSKTILRDTNNHKEKAIIFDSSGNFIFDKLGTQSGVFFTKSEMLKMKNNYLIHNHPSGSGLSQMDVIMATTNRLKEIISITNKGVFNRLIITEVMVEYGKAQMLAGSTFKKL